MIVIAGGVFWAVNQNNGLNDKAVAFEDSETNKEQNVEEMPAMANEDKKLNQLPGIEKSEAARKSAEARWNKKKDLDKKEDDANALNPHCEKDANGILPNTHNTIPNTHIKYLFDNERIIPLWNSFGCERHKGLTLKAEKALDKTYKHYCKSVEKGKEPKELNDWLESYLIKGFKPMITDHHRKFDDGKWAADLEFAIRLDTYDKVKNRV